MLNQPNPFASWRQDLNRLLSAMETSRPPALRRSLSPDFLYATDLPLCASPRACDAFRSRADAAGWESTLSGAWINLRPTDLLFPSVWWECLPPEGEPACVASLLRRHPSLRLSLPQSFLLLKALEEGPSSLEKAARSVHQDLARGLREKGRRENSMVPGYLQPRRVISRGLFEPAGT